MRRIVLSVASVCTRSRAARPRDDQGTICAGGIEATEDHMNQRIPDSK